MAALALRMTIHTAARTNEILEAVWSEIDLKKKLWTDERLPEYNFYYLVSCSSAG